MKRLRMSLWLLGLAIAAPVTAQADGGALYAYRPHTGEKARFDEGYRRHLEWHREKRDSLPWYGWDIVFGRRMGEFIDGTFGIAFAALDRRVDPAGDAADAAATFASYAQATGRWLVRLRRDLGTASPLEDRTPTAFMQVVMYRVPPAARTAFEAALGAVRGTGGLAPYAVYEILAGGSEAEYMLVVGHGGYAGFDAAERDPVRSLSRELAARAAIGVHAESELWQLRRDLTLLPDW